MTIKGKTTQFRYKGVTYGIGVPFSGLSPEVEAQLVTDGVAEYENAPVIIQNPKKPDGMVVTSLNAKDAIAFVGSINSIEELNKLGLEETEGKKRATVISAISEKIAQLEEKADNDTGNPDPEKSEEPLNLNLNPDDVIVS